MRLPRVSRHLFTRITDLNNPHATLSQRRTLLAVANDIATAPKPAYNVGPLWSYMQSRKPR